MKFEKEIVPLREENKLLTHESKVLFSSLEE